MYITKTGKIYPHLHYTPKVKVPLYISKDESPGGQVVYTYPKNRYYKKHPRHGNGDLPFSRENILLRKTIDGNTCQLCGKTDVKLHVHHLDGKSSAKYGNLANNSLSNLITLCKHCHCDIHGFRVHTSKEINQMVKLRSKGKTLQDIAIKFGISRQRVFQLLNPKEKGQ